MRTSDHSGHPDHSDGLRRSDGLRHSDSVCHSDGLRHSDIFHHSDGAARLFCLFFLLLILLPGVATVYSALTGRQGNVSEGENAAKLPVLRKADGSFNTDFLKESGEYFSKTFAGRDLLVSLYSSVLEHVFSTSSDDGVIVGKKGWLFYTDSLADYQGRDLLTDRQIFDCAWSLRLLQDYLEEQGSCFELAVAPNKASLYGDYMPDRLGEGADAGEGNMLRLQNMLDETGVCYADLYGLLSGQNEILYRRRDSHWDERGAMLASDVILNEVGQSHLKYDTDEMKTEKGKQGDLDSMLYPLALKTELVPFSLNDPDYSYIGETPETNFAFHIRTQGTGAGRLYMWRDSFGSAILPYLSEAFHEAYFTRGTPYIAEHAVEEQADAVILEIAQRKLRTLPQMPPWIPAPFAPQAYSLEFHETGGAFLTEDPAEEMDSAAARDASASAENEFSADDYPFLTGLKTWEENGYYLVEGYLAEQPEVDDRIFLQTEDGVIYEAAPVSSADGSEGFLACFPLDQAEELREVQWMVAVGKPEYSYEELMSLVYAGADSEAEG